MSEEQIIEALATKVMGWVWLDLSSSIHFIPNQLQAPAGWFRTEKDSAGYEGWVQKAQSNWNPLTNPADCKQVREKLAEQGYIVQSLSRSLSGFTFDCSKHAAEAS